MKTIGIIGLGNMGSVIATIAAKHETYPVLLSNRTHEKAVNLAEKLNATAVTNRQVFEQANVIFLGVKPNQIQELLEENKNILEQRESILLISMAAGVTLEQLELMTDTRHRWIRMMPNTPLQVAEGVISFSLGKNVTTSYKEEFVRLLQSAGLLIELPESQIDAATALAGCGPAFVYIFIEALAEAGVSMGLSREVALQLATQTVKGSASMVSETKEHPAILKEKSLQPRRVNNRWSDFIRTNRI